MARLWQRQENANTTPTYCHVTRCRPLRRDTHKMPRVQVTIHRVATPDNSEHPNTTSIRSHVTLLSTLCGRLNYTRHCAYCVLDIFAWQEGTDIPPYCCAFLWQLPLSESNPIQINHCFSAATMTLVTNRLAVVDFDDPPPAKRSNLWFERVKSGRLIMTIEPWSAQG